MAAGATAFLPALAPQPFDRMATNSLESSVTAAHPVERNLSIAGAGRIDAAAGDDPTASVLAAGEEFEQQLPGSVRAVVDGLGAGGGHRSMAKGTIPLKAFRKTWRTASRERIREALHAAFSRAIAGDGADAESE